MRYQGSKKKMVNTLKSLIEKNLTPGCVYVEPFAGGMNVMSNIEWDFKLANDINEYVIALWEDILYGKFTDEMRNFCKNLTREQYYDVKDYYQQGLFNGKYPKSIIGYVGTACSYGGGWWAGYANYNAKKNENHILEAYNGIQEQIKNFKNFYFTNMYFLDKEYDKCLDGFVQKAVIYCDPPYAGTRKYANDFDNKKFWKWAEEMVKKGHTVFVSEYNAPKGWKYIWQKRMQDGMSSDSTKIKIEKIFVHEAEIDRIKL